MQAADSTPGCSEFFRLGGGGEGGTTVDENEAVAGDANSGVLGDESGEDEANCPWRNGLENSLRGFGC